MAGSKVKEKRTTIRVPVWLRDDIKRVAKSLKVPMWKVIHSAIEKKGLEFVEETVRKGVIAEQKLDRAMWYVFKLVNSIASLKKVVDLAEEGILDKEKDVLTELSYTRRTLNQIKARLGVETEDLEQAIEKFIDNPNGKTKAHVNDVTKIVILRILMSVVA